MSRYRSPDDRGPHPIAHNHALRLALEQAPIHGRAAHRAAQQGGAARSRIMAGAVAASAVTVTAPGVGLADIGAGMDRAAPAAGGPTPVSSAVPARTAQPDNLLLRGSAGPRVRELQAVLNAWYPTMTPLAEDGRYGPETEARVRELQTRAGIVVDGIVGPQTRGVLNIPAPTSGGTAAEDAPSGQQQDTEQQETEQQQSPTAAPGEIVAPTQGELTSGFGGRWGGSHNGIDIANEIGTPIVSTADGTVVEAGPASGFGMWVRVQHADGVISVYGHVNEALVSEGDRVSAGEQIATMGNRGQSTGPHLHFEIWTGGGEKIDPMSWLQQYGVAM